MATKHPKKTATRPGKLAGKTVALVGRFGYSFWERKECEARVKQAGGTVVDAEKANPDYLLVAEDGGGKPPPIVAKVEKRHPAVEVLNEAALARLLIPTPDELRAELAAGRVDRDRWRELEECFRMGDLRRPLDLSGADFRGVKLPEADFGDVVLTGCDFRGADLSSAELSEDRALKGATLDDAKLTGASVHRSEDCRFRGADLRGVWLNGRHTRADFRRADLGQAWLDDVQFVECTFREARLADARLGGSRFVGADFIGADLSRAHAERAKLDKADFTGATLRRGDLRKASLKGANLSRADLRDAVLTGADLTGANVDGADLAGAVLTGATLKDVDTSKARNFAPPTARAPGPALKALAQVAAAAKRFESTAEVDLGGGEHALLTVSVHRAGNRPQVSATSEFHRDDDDAFDEIDAPNLPRAMLNLADRWPNATLRLDTVTAKAGGGGRRKDLQETALAAWSEAFGREVASAEDLLKTKESQAAGVRRLRETMLAELRSPAGVKKWNARPKRDREQIGPLTGLDLSGAKLPGLVVESADLRGCRFDRANLKGARMESANLEGASFARANLDGATLERTGCPGSSFEGASLKEASLEAATLTGANLRGADLTGANLQYATLEGADLTGARIDGVQWERVSYNGLTKFPAGFRPIDEMDRTKDPPPPPGAVAPVAPGSLDFPAFVERLASRIDPGRMANAKKMLKAERFQLFSEVKPDSLTGIVRSQSEQDRVYACRLAADGSFGCGTQNLKPCGGLQGAVCKHLLVLVLGLAKAGQVDAATVDGWVEASRSKKPAMDKDAMSDLFLKYKGAEAGEVDWRPTETIPEDFYAM